MLFSSYLCDEYVHSKLAEIDKFTFSFPFGVLQKGVLQMFRNCTVRFLTCLTWPLGPKKRSRSRQWQTQWWCPCFRYRRSSAWIIAIYSVSSFSYLVLPRFFLSSDDTTLASLWDEHPEIQWTVCLRLDNQRSLKNWMHLGKELGLSKKTLQKFKDPSGHSPSQIIIEKIKSSNPSLPITRIRQVLLELNLVAAARKLDPLIGINYFSF